MPHLSSISIRTAPSSAVLSPVQLRLRDPIQVDSVPLLESCPHMPGLAPVPSHEESHVKEQPKIEFIRQ